MTDRPKSADTESPIARALRMKKAAMEAKAPPPGGGKGGRKPAAGISAGASKPWMKR